MNHTCSQCNFCSKFESALAMHHQLHHENDYDADNFPVINLPLQKSNSVPRDSSPSSSFRSNKGMRPMNRTSSATKILGRLRARICKNKTLFPHPEEPIADLTSTSECTSKAMKRDCLSRTSDITACFRDFDKETYACHICDFVADRITVLDRHLLNDHKIGLNNLLKLVLAKTKDGISEDAPNTELYGIQAPYYRVTDEMIEQEDYIISTRTSRIKTVKHVGVNTDLQWSDIPDLKDNCRKITKELDKLMKFPMEKHEKRELLDKMHTLNECMCKFVDSTNMLKKVLSKEYEVKYKKDTQSDEPLFNLHLDEHDSPREWKKAHSEKLERHRSSARGEKSKLSAESYYF